MEKNGQVTLAQYKKACRQFKANQEKKGFKINLAAYILVNSLLTTINLLVVPAFPWFIFPLTGWGIGVTMHYTFGVHRMAKNLKTEEDKIEQLAAQITKN
jgi:two-component system LytT family sensor kinase